MNSVQKDRAYQQFLGFLHHDWVQLRAVVSFVNEAVGFDDLRISTPEAQDFVSMLILEGRVTVGSLDGDGKFAAWAGSKEEHLKQAMKHMPLGASADDEERVWFDQPGK